ncbi:hypothetical protein OAI24_01300 [Alphaproteobacteria bacterium]|nr:hypothetical protein [Alphaproteobacteria bacterium]
MKSTVYNLISIFPHLLLIPVILYTNDLSLVYITKLSLLLFFISFALLIRKRRILINEIDALVTLFLFFSIFSILWGSQNIETIFYCVGIVSTGALSYILVRIIENPHWGVKSLLAVLVFEVFCSFIAHNMEFESKAYYGIGMVSAVLASTLHRKKIIKFILAIFLASTSAGRFALAASMTAWNSNVYKVFFVFGSYVTLAAASSYFYLTEYHSLFLGYRISEYAVVIDKLDWSTVLIGHGYGQDYAKVFLGSKGTVEHYGIYHNFFLTVFENTGVVGLSLIFMAVLIPIFLASAKKDKSILILPILWSAILLIESPRDGPWVLFWVLAHASNEIEKYRKSR